MKGEREGEEGRRKRVKGREGGWRMKRGKQRREKGGSEVLVVTEREGGREGERQVGREPGRLTVCTSYHSKCLNKHSNS